MKELLLIVMSLIFGVIFGTLNARRVYRGLNILAYPYGVGDAFQSTMFSPDHSPAIYIVAKVQIDIEAGKGLGIHYIAYGTNGVPISFSWEQIGKEVFYLERAFVDKT